MMKRLLPFVALCYIAHVSMATKDWRFIRDNKCQAPNRPANGDIEIYRRSFGGTGSILLPGDKVAFSCHKGYTIFGSKKRRCLKYGIMSGRITSCIKSVCFIKSLPQHMQVTNGMTIDMDDYARFKCEHRYQLVGNPFVRCTRKGTFRGEFPTCIRIK